MAEEGLTVRLLDASALVASDDAQDPTYRRPGPSGLHQWQRSISHTTK